MRNVIERVMKHVYVSTNKIKNMDVQGIDQQQDTEFCQTVLWSVKPERMLQSAVVETEQQWLSPSYIFILVREHEIV